MNVWKWLPWMCLSAVAAAGDLALRIVPAVPGGELKLNGAPLKNADGESWTVTRLSCLVSGAALRRPDGSWLEQEDGPAWLNAATGWRRSSSPTRTKTMWGRWGICGRACARRSMPGPSPA